MTIISSSSSLTDLTQLLASLQASKASSAGKTVAATPGNGSVVGSTSSSSGDSSSLSPQAQLFSALQDLSKSDPTEFKKITGEIAKDLQKAAASSGSSSDEADALTAMASNFEKASQSGKFSDLLARQPSGASSGEGSGASSGGAISGSASPSRFSSSYGSSASSASDSSSPIFRAVWQASFSAS